MGGGGLLNVLEHFVPEDDLETPVDSCVVFYVDTVIDGSVIVRLAGHLDGLPLWSCFA